MAQNAAVAADGTFPAPTGSHYRRQGRGHPLRPRRARRAERRAPDLRRAAGRDRSRSLRPFVRRRRGFGGLPPRPTPARGGQHRRRPLEGAGRRGGLGPVPSALRRAPGIRDPVRRGGERQVLRHRGVLRGGPQDDDRSVAGAARARPTGPERSRAGSRARRASSTGPCCRSGVSPWRAAASARRPLGSSGGWRATICSTSSTSTFADDRAGCRRERAPTTASESTIRPRSSPRPTRRYQGASTDTTISRSGGVALKPTHTNLTAGSGLWARWIFPIGSA